MPDRIAIVGWACSDFADEHHMLLDELVFSSVSSALRDAGMVKQDAGISVLASSDMFDGRGFSNGMTTPAAGGYLNDEYRLENDASTGLIAAIGAIRGRMTDVAILSAYHNPEISRDAHGRRQFAMQVSNLSLDPFFVRPIGLSAVAMHALHARARIDDGLIDAASLADIAATEINRGAECRRSAGRRATTAEAVLSSAAISDPLTELMLPAETCGAITIILASENRARRSSRVRGWINGAGIAGSRYAWDDGWLRDPAEATRAAAARAYELADIQAGSERIACAEITAPTPALNSEITAALGLHRDAVINPSGGVRTAFPGMANGLLRIMEAVDWMNEQDQGRGLGIAHSMDDITGLVSSNAVVAVVEGA